MNSVTDSKNTFLHWDKRPEDIQQDISSSYKKLTEQSSSAWGVYNGTNNYRMCNVNEYALMKKIILQNLGQKDFYALDIGCGNFQWCVGLSKFIEEQTDLPKDITLHIVGIRGESYFGDRIVETDRCKIYSLGAFKVEELFAQFKSQGLDLENKVDLAITRWCFRHLVDPVGTFAQTYNLLRPQTGFFLLDGFFFLHEKGQLDGHSNASNQLMTQLILDTKAPFLTKAHGDCYALSHFILQRPDATPCQLPMSYLCAERVDGNIWQIGSDRVTRFKKESQKEDEEKLYLPGLSFSVNTYGDKKLHNWLKQSGLFHRKDTPWLALRDSDDYLGVPPLHAAIDNGNFDEMKKCLEDGADINESAFDGSTPLHLCIEKQNHELFLLLMDRGALTELENDNGHTPLMLAAALDTKGLFLQALIGKEANIDAQNDNYQSPLSCAIKMKNVEAVKILVKAGVKITEYDYKNLKAPEFASLFEQGIILQNIK